MKKILLSSLIAAAAAVPAIAGINNINYQAVIKDGSAVVANQEVSLKFELLDVKNNESVVYEEEQFPTTTETGYVSCQLGEDADLSTLNWGDLSLRVSVNLGGGYEVISVGAVSSVPTALYALRSADTDMIIEEVENLVQDNENTKTTLLGVNAQLAGLEGFIDDVEKFNTDLVEKLEPMMGLNYEEICDFHERVSNELIRINEVLDEMGGNEMNAYIAQLNNLKAELEAKLETISDYAATVEKVNDLEGQVENLNNISAVVRANEEAIEGLNESTETMATMLENRLDKMQGQADATDKDLENIKENLTMTLTEVNTRLDNVDGQLENLQTFATVVKEEYATNEAVDAFATMNETRIDKIQNQVDSLEEEVATLKETVNMLVAALRDMDVLPTPFNAGK